MAVPAIPRKCTRIGQFSAENSPENDNPVIPEHDKVGGSGKPARVEDHRQTIFPKDLTDSKELFSLQTMITLERQQRVRRNIEQFAEGLPKKELLLLAVDDLLEEISSLEYQKANNQDLKDVLLAVQEGFKRMDERFAAIQKQMDIRFETLQKQMDERFTAVDKRFTAMDSRFTQLQWLIGLMFAGLSLLIGWLGTRQPDIDETKLQKSLTEAVRQGFQEAVQELKIQPKIR